MQNIDVLIVGAGPVGLQMGLCLAREGISFQIIDKKAGPTTTSNAIVVNARSLEIWNTLGFLDEAVNRGLKVFGTSLYTEEKNLNKVGFEIFKSNHQFVLSLPQADTEQLLLEQLAAQGCNVQWNSELIELSQTNEYVLATYKTQEETIECKAKWIIGCDGYRSDVRELSGITRKCHDLPLHFLMVDAEASGNVKFETINLLFHNQGMIFSIPMVKNIRIVVETSSDEKYKDIKTCTPEVFRQVVNGRYPGIKIGNIDWCSAFYIHECLANNYRKGRIFIAGDAAHSHSPIGGQGMNTGLQDTWNLAWKLAMVIRGQANEELLDTYELERRATGNDVLKRTGKLTSAATTNNSMFKYLRDFGLEHFISFDSIRSKLANGIAQTDICYHASPLVHHKQVERYGTLKYPEYQSGWTVLTTLDSETSEFPANISVKIVDKLPDNFKFCIVRPDGYTAMYTNDKAELQSYFVNNHIFLF